MSESRTAAARYRRVQWQRLGVLVAGLLVFWGCLRLFSGILMPFVTAGLLAYFLDPMVRRLERWNIGRSFGAFIMILALVVGVALFVLLLYPIVATQIGILAANLPAYIKTAQGLTGHWINWLEHRLGPGVVSQRLRDLASNEAGTILGFVGATVGGILGSGFALVNVLTLLIITPIVAYYLLRDWRLIVRHLDNWLPRPFEAIIRAQAVEVNRVLAAWIRGQAICCLMLAGVYAVGLTIVGLDLGVIVGLAAGFLSFIPYVGTALGAVSSVLLSLSQSAGWREVLLVLAVFAVGQALNDYVIQPRFLGDRVGLPAVWVIFALFAGGEAFGFLGLMLAVPVTATLGVLTRFWLRRYMHSPLYLEAPPR